VFRFFRRDVGFRALPGVALGAWALLSGCGTGTGSQGEPEESVTDSGPATGDGEGDSGLDPCGDRGDSLEDLAVEGSADLHLEMVEFSPNPPIAGDNSWVVRIDVAGEPLTGAASSMVVSPTMPDHGHGTSVDVGIEEVDPGVYRLEPVNTFMVGFWEIEVAIDDGDVAGALQFGVCVE
jgi:hypothetical protein